MWRSYAWASTSVVWWILPRRQDLLNKLFIFVFILLSQCQFEIEWTVWHFGRYFKQLYEKINVYLCQVYMVNALYFEKELPSLKVDNWVTSQKVFLYYVFYTIKLKSNDFWRQTLIFRQKLPKVKGKPGLRRYMKQNRTFAVLKQFYFLFYFLFSRSLEQVTQSWEAVINAAT